MFDVLGEVTYEGKPLRQPLIEAIRLGDSPEVRTQMTRVIDEALDVEHLRALLATRALGANLLDTTKVAAVRDELERAEANRLQPHYVRDFFLLAYRRLGGQVREREPGRYELTKVPGRIRDRAREAAMRPGVSAHMNGSRSRRTGSLSSGSRSPSSSALATRSWRRRSTSSFRTIASSSAAVRC